VFVFTQLAEKKSTFKHVAGAMWIFKATEFILRDCFIFEVSPLASTVDSLVRDQNIKK
jgi:hypothetical protein